MKQDRSRKQVNPKVQNSFSEQDSFGDSIKDIDPNMLFEKLNTIWEKRIRSETNLMLAKVVLDEILKVKSITRREINNICKKTDFEKIL